MITGLRYLGTEFKVGGGGGAVGEVWRKKPVLRTAREQYLISFFQSRGSQLKFEVARQVRDMQSRLIFDFQPSSLLFATTYSRQRYQFCLTQ